MLEVTCLTYGLDTPRSKSWKVKVPYKHKELMEKNELYPEGWTYRKFFAPRTFNQGTGGTNKKQRPDDNLVDEIINEHNLQQQNDSEQNSSHANGGG